MYAYCTRVELLDYSPTDKESLYLISTFAPTLIIWSAKRGGGNGIRAR